MNKMIVYLLVAFVLVFSPIINVQAESKQKEKIVACSVSTTSVPKEGEYFLIKDLSSIDNNLRAREITYNVDKYFNVRIQDSGGSCVNSATVRVYGYYVYDIANNVITAVSLNAAFTNVPSLWTAEITSQWYNVNGSSLSYSIYYYSTVDDPFSCLVGGGPWYSGSTFDIR